MNSDLSRSLLTLSGKDVVHFLQGLLTQDVTKLPHEKIQFAALLSAQGKILHDMFLVAGDAVGLSSETILLDSDAALSELLLKRLRLYKLRADVQFEPLPHWSVGYAYGHGLPDPRHPGLPQRRYGTELRNALSLEEYESQRLGLGIPKLTVDFAPDEVVLLDAGYDLLHGVSFTKGCYVGQEITARMHYKHIARRGFYVLEQNGMPVRLALLKFEEMQASSTITRDGSPYHARLPEWMQSKFAQFLQNKE